MELSQAWKDQIDAIVATESQSQYAFNSEPEKQEFLRKIGLYADKIKNGQDLGNEILVDIKSNYSYQYFFQNVLETNCEIASPWAQNHPLIANLFTRKNIPVDLEHILFRYLRGVLYSLSGNEAHTFIDLIEKLGCTKLEIIATIGDHSYFYKEDQNKVCIANGIGEILLSKNGNEIYLKQFMLDAHVTQNLYSWTLKSIFRFAYNLAYSTLQPMLDKFYVFKENYSEKMVYSNETIDFLLSVDANKYENGILNVLAHPKTESIEKFKLLGLLNSYFPGKYDAKLIEMGKTHLNETEKIPSNKSLYEVQYEPNGDYKNTNIGVYVMIAHLVIKEDEAKAFITLKKYIDNAEFVHNSMLSAITETYGDKALPLLMTAFGKEYNDRIDDYNRSLFKTISKIDFISEKNTFLSFGEKTTAKQTRIIAADLLSKLVQKVVPEAQALLAGKTVNQRIFGALILSKIKTPEVEEMLINVVDTEKNDDTRDIILENLQDQLFAKDWTLTQVKEMIIKAEKRGKLSKWTDKNLDETKFPSLFWNDGTQFSAGEMRFLFYRMARSIGLNSEIEARKAIQFIDKSKSGAFSKYLLKAFLETDSNTKLKYYMTTSAMLGGDESVASLNSLFRKAIADKRVKLAEMVVAAMAMVGTNKALRSVEFIARKFVNKKPAISAGANLALEAAAEELSITKDELADRIIPNFEFDGLFKNFDVEGSEYRAFIHSDFTLCYFDEDNKMRKSLPKNVSKEIKTEFAEIAKEIKDVVKSQTGRLEKYLVENRQWKLETWQTFFQDHPIMFVYAMKLIWVLYDLKGNIKTSFMCQEDTSLVDIEDEEIELEVTDVIGLYHPIFVTPEVNLAWNDKLYDLNFTTAFNQTNRTIFYPLADELDIHVSKRLAGKDVPKGADFVKSYLEKNSWLKSTGDGGHLEFSKYFPTLNLRVSPWIEGPTAWYQDGAEKATIQEIYFYGKNYNDQILIKDVPAIVYSEIVKDLTALTEIV